MFALFERVSTPRVSSELPAFFDFCVLVFEKREDGLTSAATAPRSRNGSTPNSVKSTKTGRLQLPGPTT